MKPVVAIVADDLTGAGDTAVQFVRAGWSTRLSVDGAREALVSPVDVEVLAVTTHSRAMPDAEAGEAVRDNIERLRAAGASRLYKKVDSTLRGAFRAEIDAARAAWRADAIAVVCPAFPATGRTVENGVLLVNGEPVTATSAATDPVTPVTESHIPTLLGCAHVPVLDGEGPASLAARIAQAGPTVVVDARNEADLERLA
ncbi:D-threonate kinase, partial [Bordetella avium]